MKLSIHQPLYLPPLHFFNKILRSDKFILLDNVQISRSDFVHRNKILMDYKEVRLNHPIGKHKKMPKICDINISLDRSIRHCEIITQAYKDTPYFDNYSLILDYFKIFSNLSELNTRFIRFICYTLDIDTEITFCPPETLSKELSGSDLILSICKEENATEYLSGAHGKDYLKEHDFITANIKIKYQDYKYIKYKQSDHRYHPYLSILDTLFNIGAKDTKQLLTDGDNWI